LQHPPFERVHAVSETVFAKRSSHMHRVLLGLAASAAIISTSPAAGQGVAASGFSASSGMRNVIVTSQPGHGGFHSGNGNGGHFRHIHVGHDGFHDGFNDGVGYAGGYYDDGDFDGNRSFDPDKWNDWWHDRPDRAFPRWMSNNEGCQRIWWSGGGWRC
jgi:hypothetical protein